MGFVALRTCELHVCDAPLILRGHSHVTCHDMSLAVEGDAATGDCCVQSCRDYLCGLPKRSKDKQLAEVSQGTFRLSASQAAHVELQE